MSHFTVISCQGYFERDRAKNIIWLFFIFNQIYLSFKFYLEILIMSILFDNFKIVMK